MEEDVEKIERFILLSKKTFGEATELAFVLRRIKDRYRELEEKNKELYKTCCNYEDTLEHYEYKIFDELDDYIKLYEISKLDKIGIKGKKFISESKIKEKIEEYQTNMKKYEYADKNIFNENNIRQEVITVLTELLMEVE